MRCWKLATFDIDSKPGSDPLAHGLCPSEVLGDQLQERLLTHSCDASPPTKYLAEDIDALPKDQPAGQSRRSIMADLLVNAGGRQDIYSDVVTVPHKIASLSALPKTGEAASMVRVVRSTRPVRHSRL